MPDRAWTRASKLDRTTASTYLFAHRSRWLADKSVIRERVLILLVPDFQQLAGRIADQLGRDGFQLNQQGSEIFTGRLAEQIRKRDC